MPPKTSLLSTSSSANGRTPGMRPPTLSDLRAEFTCLLQRPQFCATTNTTTTTTSGQSGVFTTDAFGQPITTSSSTSSSTFPTSALLLPFFAPSGADATVTICLAGWQLWSARGGRVVVQSTGWELAAAWGLDVHHWDSE